MWGLNRVQRYSPISTLTPWRSRRLLLARGAPSEQPRQRSIDAADAWEALSLTKRKLQVAVSDEDYQLAARLRDEVAALTEALPPRKRLLLSMLDQLQREDSEDKHGALRVIGELGDPDALPRLSLCLADPALQAPAEAACWRIWLHSDNPRVEMLMREGTTMMNRPGDWEACVRLFSSIIEEAPGFAEAYNKRATVLFLLRRYSESVSDCRVVLELNPYHFAAASGMGMCFSRMGEYESAVEAFERALAIHPGLTDLRGNIEALKVMIREQRN